MNKFALALFSSFIQLFILIIFLKKGYLPTEVPELPSKAFYMCNTMYKFGQTQKLLHYRNIFNTDRQKPNFTISSITQIFD